MLSFLGANDDEHTCIFVKNTTEAINKLAHRFPFSKDRNILLTTTMEHHSNDLPWRRVARVIRAPLTSEGYLDEETFDDQLEKYGDKIALVAITGASNVTGFINPIHRIAEKAHAVGAQLLVDAAQLAPHRKIDMLKIDDPRHLDYVAISAHKMYAPYGTGALIGRRDTFERGLPDYVGGGTIELVTLDDVLWAAPPEREEAGIPDVIGVIALASFILQYQKIGMENITSHEAALTKYLLSHLKKIPGIEIYGNTDEENSAMRLGVVPINLSNFSHSLVTAILGYEFGIGVRNGCFCAHPYLLHILGFDGHGVDKIRTQLLNDNRSNIPGLVRLSFGLYNTTEEIDRLIFSLKCISDGNYSGKYIQNKDTGEYSPLQWKPDYRDFFSYQV